MATRKNSARIDRGADAAKIDADSHDAVRMAVPLGFGKHKARFNAS